MNPEDIIEEGDIEGEVVSPPTAAELGIDLPDDSEAAVALLLAEVDAARSETASHLDDLKRVAAEFDNFRKRAVRDHEGTTQRAAERLLIELLPALDSFDAALSVQASTDAEEKLLAGMVRTHQQILTALGNLGLATVPTVGEPFDPEHHEAAVSPTEGEGRLVVTQELRRGYTLNGRLVRPALVALEYQS